MKRSGIFLFGVVWAWVLMLTLSASAYAVDLGGEVAVNIDEALVGLAVIVIAALALWLKYGVKKGLKKIGLENIYPMLEPYIDNFIFQAEERSRQQINKLGIGLTGEQKLTMVINRVNEFTNRFGVDLDRPEVIGWINGRVSFLRVNFLEKVKEEAEKQKPPGS